MHHQAVYLCGAILLLVGLRIGWSYSLRILLVAIPVVAVGANFFVPDDIPHSLLKTIIVAAFYVVTIEAGFALGAFTGNSKG